MLATTSPDPNTQRAILPDAPCVQTFDIDCQLSYEVRGPTDFLFQIHATHGMDQQVLTESLQITPALPQHVYTDPSVGHRFLRLHAEAGPLALHYQARVQRSVCRWTRRPQSCRSPSCPTSCCTTSTPRVTVNPTT